MRNKIEIRNPKSDLNTERGELCPRVSRVDEELKSEIRMPEIRKKSEIRNPKINSGLCSEKPFAPETILPRLRPSAFGFLSDFGFRISDLAFAFLLLIPSISPAALVSESSSEFFGSGDFNGDGITDVLVLDKPTGNARVGYQNTNGVLTWSAPLPTGVEGARGCAIGHFLQTNRHDLAVTTPDLSSVPFFNLANTNSVSTPYSPTPGGIGPHTLIALAKPTVPMPQFDSLFVASAFNNPPGEQIELVGFSPGPLTSTLGPFNETGLFERGNALQLTTNGPTFAVGLARGDTNDTLHIWQFTNSPNIAVTLSNLPPGSDYVFGNFDGEALPRFWFYAPGQSNVTIRPLIVSGSGYTFGAALSLNFTQAVQNIYFVAQGDDGSTFIQFGDGIQGAKIRSGAVQFAPKYSTGVGANVFTGIADLDNGRFTLLSAPAGTLSSVHAQVMTFDGTNYTQISSNNLSPLTTRNTRATVWLFQTEPFTNTAATLLGSLNAPDWSSSVLSVSGPISVRVENDSGATTGLGSASITNFGAPPPGTTYGLPNQYRSDVSFFSYTPPRAAEPFPITISPPPGSYGGPIQISFIKTNFVTVFFRTGAADTWRTYATPFTLTNDATIQYYGRVSNGPKQRIQYASYTLGHSNLPPVAPVTLPGNVNTNPPPPVNTNVVPISANGTVFYGRRSANGTGTLWAINLDGNGDRFITPGVRPRVSHGGQFMSFLRENDPATNQFSLWVRELPTGLEARLHTSNTRYVGHDWSPDDTSIVFDNNCFFWRIGLTGPATQLPLSSDCFQAAPSVNPLDGRLAFQILFPGNFGLYVAPSNATSKQNLGVNVTSPRWPAWSPDGQRIAIADGDFTASINGGRNLWMVSLGAQTNAHQITALPNGADGFPNGAVWTPGGNALVAAGNVFFTNGLWVLPLTPDGTDCEGPPLRLPTSPGDTIDFAGSVVGMSPTVTYTNLGLFIRLEADVLVVYWSTNYEGFALQSAANLPAAFSWTPVNGPYFRNGPYFEYREPRAALQSRKFFRLKSPGVLILTPDPRLSMRIDSNQAVFNWPMNYVGYALESTTNLAPPVFWTPLPGAYQNTNGAFEFRKILPGEKPAEFFRLRGP